MVVVLYGQFLETVNKEMSVKVTWTEWGWMPPMLYSRLSDSNTKIGQ